ncbi:TonB-dependent receptor [Sphingobacterium alkalisoli]|uniref:TonB-dependent receptor n=1 Tax=Sphingobacterium alkalisoli TaxID=1874115 RepID=A0A4U0H3P8_9SPHI|nr:TonB-dependent receptor [Sphingobacterium alkalisoli]TJY65774.1 TonB-dependent receptor [Sphingobacterium alkalisoli]GGH18394.1 collagen-binding protein [Sphingobacterium alkalisoli]
MNKILLTLAVLWTLSLPSLSYVKANQNFQQLSQQGQIRGNVQNAKKPVVGATITLLELQLVTTSDSDGQFTFEKLPPGTYTLKISYTGMQSAEVKAEVGQRTTVELKENSIAIADVQVVGQVSNVKGATSTFISRQAIEHLQATNLGEVLQLLPGQLISNPSFSEVNAPSIRQLSDSQTKNTASLGTSIIINGAQLSNNANMQASNTASAGVLSSFSTSAGMGTDLRQISADNIESVEVIRGIPSVAYGDLTSGVIDVKTKASVEPMQTKFRLNPKLKQVWAGKGFDMGAHKGALFVDADYTYAANEQIQTSESYQRFNTSLQYTNTFGNRNQLYTNSTLAVGGYYDDSKTDPDLAVNQTINQAENYDLRFSTNGRWNVNRRFARNIQYVFAAQLGFQNGMQQRLNTGDVSAVSNALTDITQEVGYLPSNYLQRIRIEGRPLSLQAKLSDNFYFSTGSVQHGILAGVQYAFDKNYGAGKYFDQTLPPKATDGLGFRGRSFDDIPGLHQLSGFIEDQISARIADRELSIVAGLRYDHIQPFQDDNKFAISPRINASYTVWDNLKVRAGYGLSAKLPTLIYLYPENAYADIFSLNYYKENPNESLALMTTRVFNTVNKKLEIATSKKAEIGLDYKWNNNKRLSLTYYQDNTANAYDMTQYYNFTTVPRYTVLSQEANEKPVLSNVVKDSLFVVDYNTPTNNVHVRNKGFEFELDLGRFASIRTAFTLTGAYSYTKREGNLPYVYGHQVANQPFDKLGVFNARGQEHELFISTLRGIHHIPEIRLIISLTAQTIWIDKNRYFNYTSRPYAIINITKNGNREVIPLSEAEIAAIPETSGLYISVADTYHREESWKPLWLFNMKVTKEFGKNYGFSFYVNNITNNRPLQASTRSPTEYEKRNIPIFFGSELTFKF